MAYKNLLICLLLLTLFVACNKETIIIDGNTPPVYDKVPTIKIQNYVNRIFIDLLGREPLDVEMNLEVDKLRKGNLSNSVRSVLIKKLQHDTAFIDGDGSYKKAYSQYMYNLAKIRTIEGASDGEINEQLGPLYNSLLLDSLNGDWESFNKTKIEIDKYVQVLACNNKLFKEEISYDQMFKRMIYNGIFDIINMNSINFVNATFDHLLWRYPTSSELLTGYDIIEFNKPNQFFGKPCTNKKDYVEAMTETPEFFEGMIIWAYRTLLARDPLSQETSEILEDYIFNKDMRLIQEHIMITDEYANFK
jgi:hypothetical protein